MKRQQQKLNRSENINPSRDARLRVLIAAPSLDIYGGQARQAVRLIERLGDEPEIEVAFLPHNPRLPRLLGWLQKIKYVRTVLTTLLYVSLLIGRAHRYDIIHVFSASYYSYLLSALPAVLIGKLYGKKTILNYRSGEAQDHLANWRTAIPTIRLADVVVVPSGYLVNVFAGFGLKARQIFNIIELDRFSFRKRSPLRPVFLTSRLLEPLYNVPCVLRAFSIIQKRYPQARLTVAADGFLRPELEQLARELELRNTEFIGFVPFEKMPALYDSADIYLTATNIDNMPGSVTESMSAGLNVVTTDGGGSIPYIMTHEETGLIVERDNHEAMAAAAMRLLEDNEFAARLARNARESSRRFTWQEVKSQWLKLYRELMNQKSEIRSQESERSDTTACLNPEPSSPISGENMKQVLRKGLKEIVVDEVPDPVVTAHHVLVRPLHSLISSGTETASIHQESVLKEVADNPSHLRKILDVMKIAGPVRTLAEVRAKFSEYAVMGYSGAGVIVDKHDDVTDLEIGDRVAYGGEGTGHGETILAGRNLVARIPDSVSSEQACFTTLGSIALNAVRTAGIGVGDVVAVVGLGLVGQLVAQLARLQGGMVIAVDLKQDRVELAHQLGADFALSGSSVTEQVSAITEGRGADAVIVAAAAKSSAPCEMALRICRDRGRMVIVGAVEMSFPWNDMYLKEIQLFMSRAYGPGSYDPAYEKQARDYPISYVRWTENRNMEEFLRLVARGRINLEPLITHQFALEEATLAYQTILNPASGSLAVLLAYPAALSGETVASFRPRRKIEVAPRAAENGELRVALAGAGSLARWDHLPNLKKISNVSLRAIYSASGARGKSYAKRFGAEYCCSDYDEILNDPNIDVVMIMSRNQHHAPQAIAALKAGKHVFLEKPMALTDEECIAICRTVEESGKQLTVGFNRRFSPFYIEQKKQLSRRTGAAVINCRVNSPGISGSYWMADPAIGGAILGEACHFVDLMRWLLDSEPVSVSAYSLPTGKQDPIGENNLVASFRFADGSIGNLTYCTVGSRTSAGERVEAFAEGAGVVTENFKTLKIQGRIERRKSRLWAEKGYSAQLESFIAGIRKGEIPAVTARDGARATIGCLRMLESARTSSPCAIDLDAMIG